MDTKTTLPIISPPKSGRRSRTVCRFFLQQQCRKGDNCPFSHEQEKPRESTINRLNADTTSTIPSQNHLSGNSRPKIPCSKTPCRFFSMGVCSKGDDCQFSHNIPTSSAETVHLAQDDLRSKIDNPQIDNSQTDNSRSEIVCLFFSNGACSKGDKCPFSHDISKFPCRLILCRFFSTGFCYKGDKCPFSHDIPNPEDTFIPQGPQHHPLQDSQGAHSKVPRQSSHDIPKDPAKTPVEVKILGRSQGRRQRDKKARVEKQEEPITENWRRDLKGALVTFGDGGIVTKVNYPSDFSAVHISSLPPHTTTTELVHLLARLGFTVPPECICIMKKPDDLRSSANVRVEDPLFAKRLCDLLYMSENPKAVQIYAPIPQASSRWRVDSNKVQVSWHKPSKVAYLNFGAREVAFQVASNFRDGKYRVFSQGVQCGMPERSGGGEDRISWTVVLSDIPLEAEERDIKKNIPFILAPRHIEMGDTSYQTSLRKANLSIERLLLRSGKMDWWQESEERYRKKRFKAMARFTSEADARHAVRSLNNTPLSFHENGKLTVQLVHSTRLKIKDSVYEAVKDEINRQKKVWNDLHMVYTVYPPVQTFRTLKIEGQTSKDIADANATLEKILSGKVAMDEDKVLWTPLFATNSLAYRKLRGLESDLDIVIVRDKLKCQVRLLGPRPECEAARLALIDIIKADSSVTSTFSIELDAQLLTQAFWGGYRAITSAIGDGKVIVDIVSRPGRLIVVGSEAEYNAARKILESHETEEKDLVGDCAICWTKAEKPVHTFCGHVYCAECLENLCFAAASSDTGIICQGDAGECNKLLALKELQVHLQSFTLEEVLETTFKTYVARHPNDLQYCPTPDCGETYRVSTKEENEYDATVINDSLFFKCQKCIETVCTVCRVSHDGMSCADWREHSSGGYEALEEAKKKLGIKNCPRCQTMLEKSFGCNHMTCPACGAHICWVCLETFSSDMPVYNHMEAKHEGIGVEYFPDLV